MRLPLGADAAPIGLADAFGSIWVADIHANDVRRIAPDSMTEIARTGIPSAAWFAVADGALWVTSQTGTGISRIDPGSNTLVAHAGDVPPCGAPVVLGASLWLSACDADVVLRIDPVRNVVAETIPAEGHGFLVAAAGRLIMAGPDGLATLDQATHAFTPIPAVDTGRAEFLASDGDSVWLGSLAGVYRIDPVTGRTLARFDYLDAAAVSFGAGSAWLATGSEGLLEIDLATNRVVRTIAVPGSPVIPLASGGHLWATSFSDSLLWRIDP
jgi:streptogramin lyase